MDPAFDTSLTLSAVRSLTPTQVLAERVRMVLETRPGRLPYQPEFGCDLEPLAGGTSAQPRLAETRLRIQTALARWIPDVTIVSCKVELIDLEGAQPGDATIPLAERMLTSKGVSAVLQVRIVLETPEGPVSLEAQLTP